MAMTNMQASGGTNGAIVPDVAARELLLRRMSDLAVMPPGRLTAQERGLIDSVVATAITRLDVQTRRRLADRVAQLPEGPGELTLTLARDEYAVAEPVLRGSSGLQASDLVQIIRESDHDKHHAIAQRKNIPGAVVDALIEYADCDALVSMLNNPASEISNRSLEILVRRSASEPALQDPLLTRTELSMRMAQVMFWWVGPEARLEILTRYSVERRQLYAALDEVLESGLAASGTDDGLKAALSLVCTPVPATRQQIARLIDFATRHQRDEFIADMSFTGRVRPETAFRIFSDLGGEPLAVFGKAIGMSRTDFGDLLTAFASLRGIDPDGDAGFKRIRMVFDMISNDRADFALHSWDWAISAEAQLPIEE
tara:strand:- start:850 stop:1959 length:1110 start_codon:yes stop_codon:yes gene_type:complete